MRRIADLYPGEAKTDACDAFVIADATRSMPHTLRSIELHDETVAELEMIVGFDDDLAGEATRISNRLRGLLTQIHPHLERALGPRIQHPAVLQLLDQFGSPALIRKAGRRRLISLIRAKAPRMAERLVEGIFTALDEQTVVVPGTDAAALIVPSLASSLQAPFCLAGRRADVLFAMLRDGTFYDPNPPYGLTKPMGAPPTAAYFWPTATIREFAAVFLQYKAVNLRTCAVLGLLGLLPVVLVRRRSQEPRRSRGE